MEIRKNQKINFLYALIITIIVFNIGIFFGYSLESSRINKIVEWSDQVELNLLDQKLQSQAVSLLDIDCDLLIKNNMKFADTIYKQALIIDKYEKAGRINNEIIEKHKRLDLLRSILWMNSLEIKKQCDANYSNVVYFYQYNEPSLEQKAEQRFYSVLLGEIKNEYGLNVLLIPIAADNDLPSVSLLTAKFNVTSLPAILIDEKHLITGTISKQEIFYYLN